MRRTSGGRSARIRESNADAYKENVRMRRVAGQSQYLKGAVVVGLVGILALGGCSEKNVLPTTEGAGKTEAAPGPTPPPGGDRGDERGSGECNLVLGEKRALETRCYLESLGVKNALTVTSYGKERPVCAEHDESCYWRNRRAHLALEGAK